MEPPVNWEYLVLRSRGAAFLHGGSIYLMMPTASDDFSHLAAPSCNMLYIPLKLKKQAIVVYGAIYYIDRQGAYSQIAYQLLVGAIDGYAV